MSFLENLAKLTPSHMSTAGNRVVRMGDMAVVQSMEPSSVRTGSDRFMHSMAITDNLTYLGSEDHIIGLQLNRKQQCT